MTELQDDLNIEMLKSVTANIGDGISIQDKNFRIVYQNQALIDLLGCHMGEYCYKAYERNKQVCEGCPVEKAFNDGKTHVMERIAVTDGGLIYVENTVSPVRDSTGKINYVIEVVRNINSRKDSERALAIQKELILKQLAFSKALNLLAEAIISDNDTQTILEKMTYIVGKTLGVDRSLIYDVNLTNNMAYGLCEWDNDDIFEMFSTKSDWNIDIFKEANKYITENLSWIESHFDNINPLMVKDNSADLLHYKLGAKSVLYFPFSYRSKGYYLLIFHQISYRRVWREEEIEFINAVAKQVEIAIQKITFIEEKRKAEELLQQQSAAIKASNDGIAIINNSGYITYMNNSHANTFGYENTQELESKAWELYGIEEGEKRFEIDVLPNLITEGYWQGETLGIKKDNSKVPLEITINNIKSGGFVVIVRDITMRKLTERMIWEEKERAQITLQSIGDAVITTSAEGIVEYLNPVAEGLTGWSTQEAKGLPLSEVFCIINESSGGYIDNPVEKCISEGRIIGLSNHTELISRDGVRIAIEDSAAPIIDRDGDIIGAILVFHDVSDKRNLLKQMTYQAYHDPLTGLPNRLLFNDRLNSAMAYAQRNKELFAIIFLDLDNFKFINDTKGHDLGDKLLISVAEHLKNCLRESDTLSRLGGDEFIVLSNINIIEDAATIAEKILKVINQPWLIENQEFFITTSIGIAIYPNDGSNAETLMKHADMAMYRAKDYGKNKYLFFTSNMNEKITERVNLESYLRQAIIKEEFIVYYQPQINTSTNQIIGLEALVRWKHPIKGIVSPAEFIPLAEETGLIVLIDEFVLRSACKQIKEWHNNGFSSIHITVNLSARMFQQKDLVKMITDILNESKLAPHFLMLEITEGLAMKNVDYTISILNQLREMGIKFAIDDFGTGYSSLYYLKSFPLNTLKIDRNFVKDINTNPDDAAIVNTIIGLAKNLNLDVIAEGVELKEQLNFLQDRQCDKMQGYLFSKPITSEELEILLKEERITY